MRNIACSAKLKRWRQTATLACAALVVVFGTACRQDMQDQPRYEAYEKSDFFTDGEASRPLVQGTVARGYLREDAEFYTGKRASGGANGQQPTPGANGQAPPSAANGSADGQGGQNVQYDPALVNAFPFPVTKDIVDRGEERYNIYCSMCHGRTGDGNGMVVQRGYRRPPSYHEERLRQAPVGHFFDVITNGWGSMPAYGWMIPPRDRWAIVAYIRALQLSRTATINDVPPEERSKLEANAAAGGNREQR